MGSIPEFQQPVKAKHQNSALGMYYKNARPSQNVNSFQLRGSVGPRNSALGQQNSGHPILRDGKDKIEMNMNPPANGDAIRVQQQNAYIPKRNYGGGLNYSLNAASNSHLTTIKAQGGGGVNIREQYGKQQRTGAASMLNQQQSQSPRIGGDRGVGGGSSVHGGVKSKQY